MKRLLSIFLLLLSSKIAFSQICSVPSIQASNVNITNVTTNSFKISWSSGNGNYVIVVMKPASNSLVVPTASNLDVYVGSTTYASGSHLGSNNYVMYKGSSSTTNITVSGMASNFNFDVYVYAYNMYNNPFGADSYCLNTSTSGNNDRQYTLATEPTATPGISVVGTPGLTTATLSTTGAGATWGLISVRPSGTTGYSPADGSYYAPSSSYGSGTQIGGSGTNNYSTYFSSANGTVNLSNLQPATGYYARVYAVNGLGGSTNNSYNYYGSYQQVYFSTYNYAPSMNAISSQTICQDVATQTISLSGINDGSVTENQSMSFYAYASNTTLIPNVSVNYTSPNSTAQLVYTPAAGEYGSSVIYVYLYDSGPNNYYTIYNFTVTVLPKPAAAGAITTTSTTLCKVQNGVLFGVPPVANATGYNWILPPNATVTAGANTNSITVNFSITANTYNVKVNGTNSNGCGSGANSNIQINFDDVPTPSNAGPNQQICNNLTALAANVPSIGTGSWTYCSSGLANISSTTTANANLQVVNNQTVTAAWTTKNGVCPVSTSSVIVTNIFGSPSCNPNADFVADNTTPCVNSPVIFYNTSVGATSCNWYFGASATPSVSSSTSSVAVTYTSTGLKTVTLTISSAGGPDTEIKTNYLNVISSPATPGTISGNTLVCQGKTGEPYFISSVANATGYTWSFPAGVAINTGSLTNAITANFSTTATSGNIGVSAYNSCGSSSTTNLSVTANPLPTKPTAITGTNTVCQGESGVVYVATNLNYALSYTWNLPTGANITGGLNTRTITVSYDNTAISGVISVYGTNGCGDGDNRNKPITVNPLPGAAGSITGSSLNETCPLSTNVNYSISPVANATSYGWIYPSGYSVASGGTSNSIFLDASLNSVAGNIKVVGKNACGNGDSSNVMFVNIASLPVQQLCVVTVDSLSTHNEIIWEKNGATDIDSFRVYRMQTVSIDTLIGTVDFDDLAKYTDPNANPNVTSYTYKIAAVDFCGNEGPKSLEHQTIHLQTIYSPSPQKTDLMWNLYSGAVVSNYRVLRDTNNSGNWVALINNLAPNATSYTDFGIPSGALSVQYRVDVIWANSCDPTAKVAQSIVNTTKSNTKDHFISLPTDVKTQTEILNSIEVYPNPTKDLFVVELKAAIEKVEIEIYNQLGSKLKSEKMLYNDKATIDISEFSSGIYYINVKTSFGSVTKRISKL